ncbi:MAG: WGR domain-containing protein [Xanthomonadales bacterium]|nr:WGR domain-containing protein [Xanthomonadales bacterium]
MQMPPGADSPGRFYQLILQEDLLGGWTLIRQWGQLGKRGTHRQEYFDDLPSAQQAMAARREEQMKAGFSVTYVEGEEERFK